MSDVVTKKKIRSSNHKMKKSGVSRTSKSVKTLQRKYQGIPHTELRNVLAKELGIDVEDIDARYKNYLSSTQKKLKSRKNDWVLEEKGTSYHKNKLQVLSGETFRSQYPKKRFR